MPMSTKVVLPFITLMIGIILSSAVAAAYSGLEGVWTGTAKAVGADVGKGSGAAACKEGTLEVQIDGGRRMRGAIHIDGTYYLVQGRVEEDGSMTGYVGDDPITGKFSDHQFQGMATLAQLDCKRDVTLKKQ